MNLSVCMATYNGSEFVLRQLNSVIKQLRENDEIIIVDDNSSDNTVALLKEVYGDRIHIVVNEKNIGAINSFEKAIKMATGDIIFLCDQDDIWDDNKVEVVMEAFNKEDASVVVHDAFVVDGNLAIIDRSWNNYNQNKKKGLLGNIMKNSFTGACMALKRELVPKLIPFPKSIEMHDQWIALVTMLENKKIVYINEPLMKYVRHGNNVTGVKKRSIQQMVKGRIGTISAVLSYRKS